MADELLPCPFCGDDQIRNYKGGGESEPRFAYCQSCGAENYFEKWNTRTPSDAAVREWQPIETAPRDGRTLLLGYPNHLGKWRTVRGQWFSNEEIGEWENAADFEAGWYETSVENDDPPNCWVISPVCWMPLPAAPHLAARTGEEK